jgi:VanZ family protein
MQRRIGTWGPVLAWMALIFILSAQSQLPTPQEYWLDVLVEKSAHTFEFAVLAALLSRALAGGRSPSWRVLGTAVLLAWLYAVLDEWHQSFVPGRSADWHDVVFDWLGAVLGAGFWSRWWGPRSRRRLGREGGDSSLGDL